MVVAFERQAGADVPQDDVTSEARLETTRYLCGAAYTDPPFRTAVLARGREPVRSLPPEAGVDVKPVVDHARRASQYDLVRDLAITAVLIGAIVFVVMAVLKPPTPAAPARAPAATAPGVATPGPTGMQVTPEDVAMAAAPEAPSAVYAVATPEPEAAPSAEAAAAPVAGEMATARAPAGRSEGETPTEGQTATTGAPAGPGEGEAPPVGETITPDASARPDESETPTAEDRGAIPEGETATSQAQMAAADASTAPAAAEAPQADTSTGPPGDPPPPADASAAQSYSEGGMPPGMWPPTTMPSGGEPASPSGGAGFDVEALVGPIWDVLSKLPLVILWASLAAAALMVAHALYVDRTLRQTLTRTAFARRTATPPAEEADNVVVYAGFSPFVGAGVDLGGWSFAVDLDRGRTGIAGAQKPQPFALEELYAHVAGGFERLRTPHVGISRKLFVSGRAIRTDRRFLPDIYKRPVSHVADDLVAAYADGASQTVRHYLCVETLDWNGELGLTVYVRFRHVASRLFIEASTFLLEPLKPSYYELDRIVGRRRIIYAITATAIAAVKGPFMLFRAPLNLLRRLGTAIDRIGLDMRLRREIDQDALFDYGAGRSLREMATTGDWRVYFQMLDKEMHLKILQQQLLDSIVDFLDARGIDTNEIKERSVHIMNTGVIVSGGTINAQSLAVGSGARAKVSNAARRRRTAKAAA